METKRDNLFVISVTIGLVSIIFAVFAFGFAARAASDAKDKTVAVGAATATPETVSVSEKEFSITPVSVRVGGAIHVTNEGTVAHNVVIEDTGLATKDLASGVSEHLPLTDLRAGTYTMYCAIPGHREAGMQATLTVTEGASGGGTQAAGGDHSSHDTMDYAAMEKAMLDTMAKFPATTKGTGNTTLEPSKIEKDGTKVFNLVAKIADWERSPGDVVKAWTYNGVVPAPSIHLNVGDKAKFVLKNELPIGTDLHLHGLNVDNKYDGVAPITQPVIEPGGSFTYEYTADEVSVAMYHPHFHSQIGLPNGMFGTIFVGQVPIPRGKTISGEAIPADLKISQEFPMVLNDSGVIGYSLNGKSFPATAPIVGNTGDWVLLHYFNEGTQIHPMHLHQFDQIVIAKDGFPIDTPYAADVVNVAPGERYSVLVQLNKPGTWVWHCHILPHVEGEQGMFGMVTAVVVK